MARIRSVKPELRTSLTAIEWPREVRYFWVLLWGYLDDHGYGLDEPRVIRGDCFPMDDDLSAGEIDKWLDILAHSGSLCRFLGPDGRRYLHAPKWAEHQRPQHPALPKFPACERLSHETVMNGSHETFGRDSGDTHEADSGPGSDLAVSAGEPGDGESHESLTLEGEIRGSRGGGVARVREPRTRAQSTLLGNALLEEHRRLIKPSLPRDVLRRIGEQIDLLLDDPEITSGEVRAGLAKMRANPKLGPGVLSSLVHEVRQIAAHPELGRRFTPRQQAEQAQRQRAFERAQAKEGR